MTYTQLEDPENPGYYESFTCQAVYKQGRAYADPESVIVRNYYGTGRFSETAQVTPQVSSGDGASETSTSTSSNDDPVDPSDPTPT